MLLIIYVTHDGISRHLMTFNDRKNIIIYSFLTSSLIGLINSLCKLSLVVLLL